LLEQDFRRFDGDMMVDLTIDDFLPSDDYLSLDDRILKNQIMALPDFGFFGISDENFEKVKKSGHYTGSYFRVGEEFKMLKPEIYKQKLLASSLMAFGQYNLLQIDTKGNKIILKSKISDRDYMGSSQDSRIVLFTLKDWNLDGGEQSCDGYDGFCIGDAQLTDYGTFPWYDTHMRTENAQFKSLKIKSKDVKEFQRKLNEYIEKNKQSLQNDRAYQKEISLYYESIRLIANKIGDSILKNALKFNE